MKFFVCRERPILFTFPKRSDVVRRDTNELELELIQSHMAQKPMLRGEVGARALRVRSDVRGHGQVRLCKALGCGRCGCLKPIRACCVVGSAFFLVAPPRGGCAMAPRDSGMCWKQFMMCLEEIQFVAGVHSPPMHDPELSLALLRLPPLMYS